MGRGEHRTKSVTLQTKTNQIITVFTSSLGTIPIVNSFMKASGFPLRLHNYLQSLDNDFKLIRNLYLSKVLPTNLLKDETLLQTHLSTATTICK